MRTRVIGGALVVLGIWLFLAAFISPSLGIPLARAATGGSAANAAGSARSGPMTAASTGRTGTASMGGMGSSSSKTMRSAASTSKTASATSNVIVNRGMVFFAIIPGVLLVLFGLYQLFEGPSTRTRTRTA